MKTPFAFLQVVVTALMATTHLHVIVVRADTLSVAMIKGTGVPSRVQRRIENGLADLLDFLKLAEPSDYDIYAPGEVINTTAGVRRRELLQAPEESAQLDAASSATTDGGRELQTMKTCPSSCSTSGRNYCRSMGCAYCSRCRRRNLRGDLSLVGAVEFTLSKVVSLYCLGVVGCKLWVELLTVNDDGSLTPAN
jgi:hypothetical protein